MYTWTAATLLSCPFALAYQAVGQVDVTSDGCNLSEADHETMQNDLLR